VGIPRRILLALEHGVDERANGLCDFVQSCPREVILAPSTRTARARLRRGWQRSGKCKKALKWLTARGIPVTVRAIVEEPPTAAELAAWIPASGKSIRKWLNTSGQSYRALGKAAVDAMSDADLVVALTKDGKLVKRPIVVRGSTVLVGFDEVAYDAAFG